MFFLFILFNDLVFMYLFLFKVFKFFWLIGWMEIFGFFLKKCEILLVNNLFLIFFLFEVILICFKFIVKCLKLLFLLYNLLLLLILILLFFEDLNIGDFLFFFNGFLDLKICFFFLFCLVFCFLVLMRENLLIYGFRILYFVFIFNFFCWNCLNFCWLFCFFVFIVCWLFWYDFILILIEVCEVWRDDDDMLVDFI